MKVKRISEKKPLYYMKAVARFVCVTMIVVGLGACGSDSDSTAGQGDTGEYVVGYIAGQTGFLAPFEKPFQEGLTMRVAEINEAGGIDGRQIKVVTRDGKSDPAHGAVVARDLIGQGAQFLINPCDADVGLPSGQVAQQRSIPALSSCGGSSTFPAAVGDFQFLNTPGTFAEGSAIADYAHQLEAETAFLMRSKDVAYFDTLASATETEFERAGGRIVGSANYTYGAPSFAPQVTQIVNQTPAPDIVFLLMNIPDSVVAIRELAAQGFTGQVIMSYGNDTPAFFQAGDALDEITAYIVTFSFPEPGSKLEKFNEAYEAEYGSAPDSVLAALGADAADVIAASVEAAGSVEPDAVRAALNDLVDVDVTSGPRTYKGYDRVPRMGFVVQTPDGDSFKLVDRFYPDNVYQP